MVEIVRIKIESKKEEYIKRLEEEVRRKKEVKEWYMMKGDEDYIIRVEEEKEEE